MNYNLDMDLKEPLNFKEVCRGWGIEVQESKREENKMALTSPKGPIQRPLLSLSRQEMMVAWPSVC